MVRDDQDRTETQRPAGRSRAVQVAVLSLLTLGVVLLSVMLMGGHRPEPSAEPASATAAADERIFRGWPRPDLALVVSGQQFGFLQPCGCSRPQLGGLARRYNLIQQLKARGWPVVAVDVGDIAQKAGPQTVLKYKTSMEALYHLGYLATGIGPNEMGMPLIAGLAEYSLNNPSPRVLAANLKDAQTKFPDLTAAWEIGGQNGVPRVGVVGVVGPKTAEQSPDPDVRFEPVDKVLPGALRELQAKGAEFLVLLYQGHEEEARACAARYPQFQVVLCATSAPEPSGQPERVGNAFVISVGHKGRYVGVVGATRTGRADRPWELRYELVGLGEEYETPEGKEANNPIHALLERYAREVKDGNYLTEYNQVPHEIQLHYKNARYVGSEKCKKCHEKAYEIWKQVDEHGRSHARAFASLEEARRPSYRQFDPECVQCHVVGFGYLTGYRNEKETPFLKDVGCEVCHGPGSEHVKGVNTPELLALMNPLRPAEDETPEQKQQRMNRLDQFCQKCHDTDNDVHWDIKKWDKIAHPEPKE